MAILFSALQKQNNNTDSLLVGGMQEAQGDGGGRPNQLDAANSRLTRTPLSNTSLPASNTKLSKFYMLVFYIRINF